MTSADLTIWPHLRLLCSLVNQGGVLQGASGWKSSGIIYMTPTKGNPSKLRYICLVSSPQIWIFWRISDHPNWYTSSLHGLPLLPRISEKCRPWNSGHLSWIERSQILWQPPRVFRKIQKKISGKKSAILYTFTFDKGKSGDFAGGDVCQLKWCCCQHPSMKPTIFVNENFSSNLTTVGLVCFTKHAKKNWRKGGLRC